MDLLTVDVAAAIIGAIGSIAAVLIVVSSILFQNRQQKLGAESQREVEVLASAVKASVPADEGGADREWQLVQRLVGEYHGQALSQARVQFWFSVIAAFAGFAMVLSALIVALTENRSALQSLTQVLPGAVIEVVAALFFKQAGETRERATALYDRLRTDRQRTDAVALVNSIDSSIVRNAVKAELALHIAGLQNSPLTQILPNLLMDSGGAGSKSQSPFVGAVDAAVQNISEDEA